MLSHRAELFDAQAPAVLILIERICQLAAVRSIPVIVNSFTIHRLVLASVLLTSKVNNDLYYSNSYLAEVGGVSLSNINDLELYFMQVCDYRLNITTEEFDFFENQINVCIPQETPPLAVIQ